MVHPTDLEDRSKAFLGNMVVGNNFQVAEVQALWTVAYLDGRIEPEEMGRNVAKTVARYQRRYLNKGELGSYFFFDIIEYADMLLQQLGLSSHRQKSWFGDSFGPCRAADLRGLRDEYKALHPP
ncbi:hypothetical protein MMC21_006662 [Puttea exsequens]|nr:hypothetical protein [Puttea exsequens]